VNRPQSAVSPRFPALVPETQRDHRRFAAIPEMTKAPQVRVKGARTLI
jgi:hypothetical protein